MSDKLIKKEETEPEEPVIGSKKDIETKPSSQLTYFNKHEESEKDGKKRVAKHVYKEHLKDGDSFILDAGTSSGDNPAVIGSIIPAVNLLGHVLGQLF